MNERIEKIRAAGGDHAADVLEAAGRELEAAGARAKSGRSADIKEYQSRAAAFERTLSEFEQLYKTDTFKNLSSVYSYLTEQGYKIANRTIYQHRDEGKLKSDESGRYLQKAVDEYAAKYLDKADGDASRGGSLVDQKNAAEIRLKELRAERERILIDEASGRLISRDVVGREFAARIEEIKRGFEEMESSLPALLAGRDEREIRAVIKAKHDYILEQYSRKLEAVR